MSTNTRKLSNCFPNTQRFSNRLFYMPNTLHSFSAKSHSNLDANSMHLGQPTGTNSSRGASPMQMSKRAISILALVVSLACVGNSSKLLGQEAPLPRLVIGSDDAPESVSAWFDRLADGKREISVDSAEWLQLQFAEFSLGDEGVLQIAGTDDQTQDFTMDQLRSWSGLTAMFNGSSVSLTLNPNNNSDVYVQLGQVTIGLPAVRGANPGSASLTLSWTAGESPVKGRTDEPSLP